MSLTSYEKAITRFLNPADLMKIEHKLEAWSLQKAGRVVVPNLRDLEWFLPEDDMFDLLNVVLANYAEPIDRLQSAYEIECYSHIAKGGQVPSALHPPVVGKAVDRGMFSNWLLREYPHKFIRPSSVDDFIDGLLTGSPLDPDEKLFLLGSKFLVWVTWNHASPTDYPFHFVGLGLPDEVRANMGLESNPSDSILMLVYNRPPTLTLHRPTVSDAGLFTFFQPSPKWDARHGWTRPWPPSCLGAAATGIDVKPRPEAVHHASEATMEMVHHVRQLP
jgi:hypothetical protein